MDSINNKDEHGYTLARDELFSKFNQKVIEIVDGLGKDGRFNRDMTFEFLVFVLEGMTYELNIVKPDMKYNQLVIDNKEVTQPITMYTKVRREVKPSSQEALSIIAQKAVLGQIEEMNQTCLAYEEDLKIWNQLRPTLPDWEEWDKKVIQDLYKGRSIFNEIKNCKSPLFPIEQEIEYLNQWQSRVRQLYNNIIFDTFFGTLIAKLSCCVCGLTSYQFSLFSGIEVDIKFFTTRPGMENTVAIERLISQNFSIDYEKDRYCRACRARMYHQTCQRLYRYPKMLVIDLEKQGDWQTEHIYVKLAKTNLNLAEYTHQKVNLGEYSLRGFVNRQITPRLRETKKYPNLGPNRALPTEQTDPTKYMFDDYELIYYCDYARKWMHYSKEGLDPHPDPQTIDGSNKLSYCLYELTNTHIL